MDRRYRVKSELHITRPVAFVFGDERFIIPPPAALLSFQGVEEVDDDYSSFGTMAFHRNERNRWALSVGGRVLAVTRPDGKSGLHKSVPGDEYTIVLSAESTRTRRDFREWLVPQADEG
jgi:hypothetical protein